MSVKIILVLTLFIITALGVGFTASSLTTSGIRDWYPRLEKPALTPPSWIFAPVWTSLYIMMGVAGFLIFQSGWDDNKVKVSLILYIVQLVINGTWSLVFFSVRNPGLAMVNILILWILILICIVQFFPISKTAALLMIPYLLWVSFASYLNFFIWRLN
ncbi:MAG: hypothetical protein APR63_02470 [Desulfuromonas sp. SDB]|nr:MAG: hypothetical protein APR63_02470 [Desulfuromonas sp. SDB]